MDTAASHHTLREEFSHIKKQLEQIKIIVDRGLSQHTQSRISTRHSRRTVESPISAWARDLQEKLESICAKVASMESVLAVDQSRRTEQQIGHGGPDRMTANEPVANVVTTDQTRQQRGNDEPHLTLPSSSSIAPSPSSSLPSSPSSPPSSLPSPSLSPSPHSLLIHDAIWDAPIILLKSPLPEIRLVTPSTDEAIAAITQLSAHDGNKVSISRDTDLAKLALVSLDENVYFRNLVEPGSMKGSCHVTIDRCKAPVEWPDTSQVTLRPTDSEMEEAFENFISNPPQRVSYYGGCASEMIDNFLSPLGKTLPDISHANIPYFHIGEEFSSTPFHREDANFWSCNIVEFGWKLWIIIRDTVKFEQFIKKNWQTNDCRNFLRHLDLMLSPSLLRQEAIAFDIYCAGRGEMIITPPGVYHQVLNYSPCIALSINFLLPNQQILPDGFKVCQDCGLYPWNDKEGVATVPRLSEIDDAQNYASKLKRRAPTLLEGLKRKTRAQHETEHAIDSIRALYPDCIPAYDILEPPPFQVIKLAVGIRSMMTINHIKALTQSVCQYTAISTFTPSQEDRLSLCGRVLNDASRRSNFSSTRLRIAELELILEVNARKPGYLKNIPPKIRSDLMTRFSWTGRQLQIHLERGKAWARLCGHNKTLLCFLPSKGNSLGLDIEQYKALEDADLSQLHNLLSDDHARHFFKLAEQPQEAILCLRPGG